MSITFPTGPRAKNNVSSLGQPTRANHCRCPRPMLVLVSDHPHQVEELTPQCVKCGHQPKHLIDATWQRRAAELSRQAQARARRRENRLTAT